MYIKITKTYYGQIQVQAIEEEKLGGIRVNTGHDSDKNSEWWIISDKIEAIEKLHEVQHIQFAHLLDIINNIEIY